MKTLSNQKKRFLMRSGTLNSHPEAVESELFKEIDFFDPHDRAQVKYEMLRAHWMDGETVSETCRKFGFSRESFYKIMKALREQGFGALSPQKRGRKGPTKLKGEVLEFAFEAKEDNPDIDPGRLSELITERFGVEVHRTTVMRGMKKKLHSRSKGPKKRRGRKGRSHTGDL